MDIITEKGSKAIVLSGHDHEDLVLDSHQKGAVFFITKTDNDILKSTIRQALNENSPINIVAKELRQSREKAKELELRKGYADFLAQYKISAGEERLLLCLLNGITDTEEIAKSLHIEKSSVLDFNTKLMKKIWPRKKLRPQNKAEAAPALLVKVSAKTGLNSHKDYDILLPKR